MSISGLPLLELLRREQLALEIEADKKNERRRRIFKSWFGRNLHLRYATHTRGMDLQPLIVDWLPTKQLDDTYRGSPKDTMTSTKAGHGYQATTRMRWSAIVFRTALAIVLESSQLNKLLIAGRPLDMHMVSDLVRKLINESLDELLAKRDQTSPYGLVCNIKFPKGLLATASMEQLEKADVTITFVKVSRRT